MSPADDDIAAALPRPPHPAPARREAAIAAAMRRFDGVGEPDAAPSRPVPAASWSRRPYIGALAGAALVALMALPLAWTSFDDRPYRDARTPSAPASREPARPGPAADRAAMPPPRQTGDQTPPSGAAAAPAQAPVTASPVGAQAAAEPAPPMAPPPPEFAPPPPPPPAEPAASAAEAPPAAPGREQIVVTGSRIRRPNLESASPLTVADAGADDGAITVTGSRVAARASSRRGDWNACTVEDPRRSLGDCRVPAATADGLAKAWTGDWEGANRAFDSAVAAAPRSSSAYLNRGLARRRAGELERALADLDRAVRFSPRAARYYFHRGQILRQLGDAARARADEARAVELDPRYASVVPVEGRR